MYNNTDSNALSEICICVQPMVTLDGSVSYTFPNEGMYSLTVQVAAANLIFQDTKTIAVRGK